MIVGTAVVKLYAPWVHSLKEKRKIVKSLINKAQHRFNVSIAEIDALNSHQMIVLGAAIISNNAVHAHSMLDNIIKFIETNTEADIIDIQLNTMAD